MSEKDNSEEGERPLQSVLPGLLEELNPEQRAKVVSVVQHVITLEERFKGPLPPPRMLAEYDRLIPKGAERLMALVEMQVVHRHNIARNGQWMGFGLAVFFGIIGLALAIKGMPWVAGIVFTTTIVGLISVFVLGRAPKSDASTQQPSSTPGK